MFFHITVFLYSVFFFALFEIALLPQVSEFLYDISASKPWAIGILILAIGLYTFDVGIKVGKRKDMTPAVVIFSLSSFALMFLIDAEAPKHAFIFLVTAIYYLLHLSLYRLKMYAKDQTARGLVSACAIAAIFSFYAAAYGIYINFALPLWLLIIAFTIATVLISYQCLILIGTGRRMTWNYSFILGFIMAEITWVSNFWPFGYLTTGVVALIFYYVFWDIVQAHFLEILTKKRIVTNVIIFSLLIFLVLVTSKWMTVV